MFELLDAALWLEGFELFMHFFRASLIALDLDCAMSNTCIALRGAVESPSLLTKAAPLKNHRKTQMAHTKSASKDQTNWSIDPSTSRTG